MRDEDVDGKCRNMSACSSTTSYSTKLFLFMVPLVLISAFVFVNIGPKTPTSFLTSLSTTSHHLPPSPSLPPAPAPALSPLPPEILPSLPASSLSTKVESIQDDYNRTIQMNLINVTTSSSNVTSTASLEPKKRRVLSNLEKIEFELQKARASIKAASMDDPVDDPDYVPLGPMYWNAKVFHRSYLEMEKQFKIYVYKEGEPPLFHDGPCKSIYSMEGSFIYEMETDTRFRTNNPDKAHAFYLPFSVVKMVRFVYERNSRDFSPIRNTVRDYINLVGDKYPYWNRSIGADHFILSCHDWGPEASFSHPHLGHNSIRALCNANTSERFKPRKDVSIPEINLRTGSLTGLVGGPSPSSRPILAFFAGGVHGPVRPVLLEHWENKDNDIRVHKYLPRGTSYSDMMRNSKFCICPSGYEVASPRIVEALYSGCVPVLINSGYVPPFSDVLNWRSFSVIVSVEDIPNLKTILTAISPRQYLRMYRRVLKVRRHFEVNSPAKRFDVFHMILHSIWVRRLNVRIREV
ncbi:Exostosin-like [Arabidopsis thaliana x Arabidopsis arenosa]|uniref:Exostosin-like n=1 Tax=Arabidopsis thaliana x Arabidopsis arenosa TaxID=1240361 RepID=A0A8T1YSF9_9BRAS|nr:Exostosin-like [Arabidopsis thaliana x Arabidopsis arenosa]